MPDQRRAIRTVTAPTRAEAETAAAPVRAAFASAGWTEQEAIWIPGDRRVGLGESLLIDAEQQILLEADGTLRIAFVTDAPGAVEPEVAAAAREPDTWEEIGGTRYRRLVPRYAIGIVVFLVGLLVIGALWAGRPTAGPPVAPGVPGDISIQGWPAAADGTCPAGTYPEVEADGTVICWDAPLPGVEATAVP